MLDDGKLMLNEEGSAQGNIISPILANIYMHNVLTLWYKFIITKECKGDNFLIVYADDFVAGFQYKWEAENYYKLLKERMEKFGLQLEDSKSRLLQSGAYIARAKQKSGECIRLQTFDFLGFTFYCGRSRKGMPYIMPKTSSKKFRQKIRDIKVWLYANRDQPLKKLMGMSKGEFNPVAQVNGGLDNMINMINWDGKDKDLLALIKYIADEDKLEKVLENPQVIKTPVVRNGKQSTLGYQPDVWKGWS